MTAPTVGIRFPLVGSSRSSSVTGAAVLAASFARVDETAAAAAEGDASRWRKKYARHFAASTTASVDAKAAVAIAEDGRQALWERLVWTSESAADVPVIDWAGSPNAAVSTGVSSQTIAGRGERVNELRVPYRGQVLSGSALEAQLATWVRDGVVEAGFAQQIQVVIDNPELLSMPGHTVTLLGAAAAMGPLSQLTQWGVNVIAVDVPFLAVQERITAIAAAGSGQVTVPVVGARSGLHVSSSLPLLRGWLAAQWKTEATPVLSTLTYADGAAHVEANLAGDVLADDLVLARPDAMLAYLNTPTDSFLVPADAVAQARSRALHWRWNSPAHRVASRLTGRRLFENAYEHELVDGTGSTWGLSDTLVDIQGPNYALAKRLQRWRAVEHQNAGGRVSSTVAPASWTRSVTKNRVLASVYRGAAPFGVEIFDPETAGPLLAAKMVADAFTELPDTNAHPESVFAAAAHGGLWRQPFEPRSALTVAALLGAPSTFLAK